MLLSRWQRGGTRLYVARYNTFYCDHLFIFLLFLLLLFRAGREKPILASPYVYRRRIDDVSTRFLFRRTLVPAGRRRVTMTAIFHRAASRTCSRSSPVSRPRGWVLHQTHVASSERNIRNCQTSVSFSEMKHTKPFGFKSRIAGNRNRSYTFSRVKLHT